MRKQAHILCLMIAMSVVLASCLGSSAESDSTLYDDMAITALTLGTLKQATHTTSSSTGNDTVIWSSLTGSNYKMTIDQVAHTIYNQTPLPAGTDLEHVLISSVSTRNSGLAYLLTLTGDTLLNIAKTDSIDFSVPRVIRVFAIDGSGSRDYTMTLTKETAKPDFEWLRVIDNVGSPFVADTTSWDSIMQRADLKAVLGTATEGLFAMGNDGLLKASADNGLTWTDEQLDESPLLLPTDAMDCVSWPYAVTDSTDYVLLVGAGSDDTKARVWRKISQYGSRGKQAQWVYMPFDDINYNYLPRPTSVSLTQYEGTAIALIDGQTIYTSRDQGISWMKSDTYALPASIVGEAEAICATADGHLWLKTASQQVWRGQMK